MDDEQRRAAHIELVRTVMQTISESRYDDLAEYVAEDLVFELPFGPDFLPNPIEGRDAWDQMQRMTFALFSSFRLEPVLFHELTDPDQLIAEYRSEAVVARNGNDYRNRYIGVFRFRDGQISHWREFHNPEATQVL